MYGRKVLNYLRDNKNYIVTSIITDTTGCSTVSQIYDLNCLTDHIKLGDRIDLLLLISIDEYVQSEDFPEYAYETQISGGLYSTKIEKFIWKNTRRFDSDGQHFLGYFRFLDNAFQDLFWSIGKISLKRIMDNLQIFLWDFPPYIEGNNYEKQIKSTRIMDDE